MQKLSYVMVTPAKNEEDFLPGLIMSISGQNIRPIVWCIVDDCSDDHTSDIVKDAIQEHPWIRLIHFNKKHDYSLEDYYSAVCRAGFDDVLGYCAQNGIGYDCIALSDADMTYPPDYFSRLLGYLSKNPKVGIVSGKLLNKDKKGNVYSEFAVLPTINHPHGTGRVWRREAFEATGGYELTKSPDTVSNVMALLRGWDVKLVPEAECYHMRDICGKIDLWNGYENKGLRDWFLGVNPLGAVNTALKFIFISRPRRPVYKSIAYIHGYFGALLKGEKRTDNLEVRKYLGSYRNILHKYGLLIKEIKNRLKGGRSFGLPMGSGDGQH
jgi:glycosyltransferase involved in cell wall biosynthesis